MAKEELKIYTVDDLLNELTNLLNETTRVLNTVPKEAGVTDARITALSAIQTTLIPIIFSNQCVLLCSKHTDINQFAKQFNMPTEQLTYYQDNLTKVSLIVFSHFKIENLFSNILLSFNPNHKTRGFEVITKDLFDLISLNDKENAKNTLKVLSSIRNSIHNNSIHKNEDFRFQIGSQVYEFIKGEAVKSDTFEIIQLIKEILKIIEEVINSEEVLALPMPIKDLRNFIFDSLMPDDFINVNK